MRGSAAIGVGSVGIALRCRRRIGVSEVSESRLFGDAEDAYSRCVADVVYARAAWVEAGRPMTQTSANGMSGVHPLLKAVHECETLANKLRVELGLTPRTANRRGPGRPPGAVSAPDRVPQVRLRSVE
jgi:hypothetical protein